MTKLVAFSILGRGSWTTLTSSHFINLGIFPGRSLSLRRRCHRTSLERIWAGAGWHNHHHHHSNCYFCHPHHHLHLHHHQHHNYHYFLILEEWLAMCGGSPRMPRRQGGERKKIQIQMLIQIQIHVLIPMQKKKLIPNYLRWDFHISSSVNSKHSEGCFSTSQWNKMKRTTVNMK